MKEKLNLSKLSKKELKATTGGATCFCICRLSPERVSDLDFSNFVITNS